MYPKIRKANKTLPDLIPSYLSEKCSNFLLNILNTNPEKRFKIKDIKRDPWIRPRKDVRIKCKSRNERRKTDTENIRTLARAALDYQKGRHTRFESNKVNFLPMNFHAFSPDERKNQESSSDNTVITEEKLVIKSHQTRHGRRHPKRKFLNSIDVGTAKEGWRLQKNLKFLSPINSSKKRNRSIMDRDSSVSERGETEERTRTRCTSLDYKSGCKVRVKS